MTDARGGDAELEQVDALLELMASRIQHPSALSAEEHFRSEAERHFCGSRRLSALERLDIYREQFWLRHTDSLAEDFPGTRSLLGRDFEQVVRGYLAKYPPATPSLRELGFHLPDYLALRVSEGVSGITLDMARLERAYLEVFDAPDEPPLDPAEVAALGPDQWPTARLELSTALRLLELSHPVADLRRALLLGGVPIVPSPPASGLAAPIHLVVYRRELGLWDKELSADAFALLRELAGGAALGVACEATAQRRPGAAQALDEHLSEWFSSWTRLGWISRVVVSAP